ncbi:Hypothetical protein R9X50_00571200 [Acrodontium crateriforme]|uniref:AAA+ ATPase domain-containing protein n=1 Tax=Acrodontium crateriforme TaxID=150365 RepID=A0AAQ3M7L0_9PEZI|nr:Hypothetical protein R9X50_00571200 [Acrodontium crateriforme]
MADIDASRAWRLSSYFKSIIKGKRTMKGGSDAKLFLESICSQADRTLAVEQIIANPSGIDSVKHAVRFDISASFINTCTAPFINYLSDPALRHLCDRQYLDRLLLAITEPITLLNELAKLLQTNNLAEQSILAFAWLLHELLMSPDALGRSAETASRTAILAQQLTDERVFVDCACLEARTIGHKIAKLLRLTSIATAPKGESTAGGRHDNDFADFRKIVVIPTADELLSKETPFYRRADTVFQHDVEDRPAVHLDNQFRLLREEMLAELRLDIQAVLGTNASKRRPIEISNLALAGIELGESRKRRASSLKFRCMDDIPRLKNCDTVQERATYLSENRKFLKNQAFGCILHGNEIVGFARIERDEQRLARNEPLISLRIAAQEAIDTVLQVAVLQGPLRFVLMETPVFAFSPILERMQKKTTFPLATDLLSFKELKTQTPGPFHLPDILEAIETSKNLKNTLDLPRDVVLDSSQVQCLTTGLRQAVSLIQGPPGTGKSFIGSLLAKIIYDNTQENILVLCYTNHALDQFLVDLIDIGVPESSLIRLGSKASPRTEHLSYFRQSRGERLPQSAYAVIESCNNDLDECERPIRQNIEDLKKYQFSDSQILDFLEFSEGDFQFFDAFTVPKTDDDMQLVGRDGKQISVNYLINRWRKGQNPGIFTKAVSAQFRKVWEMDQDTRAVTERRWKTEMLDEKIRITSDLIRAHDRYHRDLKTTLQAAHKELLRSKRVVGCTTTGAAMYTSELQAMAPGVLLVEEAGEILESHILTAMTQDTKGVILIGDHKQLRPKVNKYELTVEKGAGYNLNQSLFERLILEGYPHKTLNKQHRMAPEISAIVRHLTYPSLEDASQTLSRPNFRGFQDRVMFVHHEHPETEHQQLADRRDVTAKTSKNNIFEAEMVLQVIRYIGQQGYGTSELVILTPYLGQLMMLQKCLAKDNDPVLNDLDSFDLVRAGLMSPASSAHGKRPIKISTIDNYQGEESDIVVVSLTRSNAEGDIGFMRSPERLNVLLSRARIGLILIGNAKTFAKSSKGIDTWGPFFDFMKGAGHLYSGVPVKCERHPARTATIQNREEFMKYCPDGGCFEPCESVLNCGQHTCSHRCHQLSDHSKMDCGHLLEYMCSKNHRRNVKCCELAAYKCPICACEQKKAQERLERDRRLQEVQEQKQQEYADKLAVVQDEIDRQEQISRDRRDDKDRSIALKQKKLDLDRLLKTSGVQPNEIQSPENTKSRCELVSEAKGSTATPDGQEKSQTDKPVSIAEQVWEKHKKIYLEANEHMNELMAMIGLEEVKAKFLSIKAEIDLAVRQRRSLKDERFSAMLLGNPGTGKTTVARLYCKFLTSVGALPGNHIEETTGSRLASGGPQGCQSIIETIMKKGGGALFIDEAYQLISSQSHRGSDVLDFLLAEVENLRGKIVFILAGYNKQMEELLSHNPGLPSRFPCELQFNDYTDQELLRILQYQIAKKYLGALHVEGGLNGLYMRIVATRVGRGRGKPGFGNARAIENALGQISSRQANRIHRERLSGKVVEDLKMTQEDLIGLEPSKVLENNDSWIQLSRMIGLTSVKDSLKGLLSSIQQNYLRELDEKPLVEFSLNRVLIGSPGTGKTTVAKRYGQILADVGLLSRGEVVIKTPADFIGSAMGQSEKITKAILESTKGKVLVIDEAYGLSSTMNGGADPYKTAVIDAIVGEIQSTPGDDRCVLLLGYEDQMEAMFQTVNPGLSRRFPMASAFRFEDFTDDELRQILDLKLKQQGLSITDEARRVAAKILQRARNRPNFGNAGEIDIMLNDAKLRQQKRASTAEFGSRKTSDVMLHAKDFDPDFNRISNAETNIEKLFADVIGARNIVEKLLSYQHIARRMTAHGLDPRDQIPFNFLFRGPPGSGKTTTARKMGKVYFDMELLNTAEVIECSATELVGEYIGQTGPKTQKLLEKGLGKVLFIDEAYRLADGPYAKEAMDEIVNCLTNPKFAYKLIVILAGYPRDINILMATNPGLISRFPETIEFESLKPDDCINLLTQLLLRRNRSKQIVDCTILEHMSLSFRQDLLCKFRALEKVPNWGNARDIQTLNKKIFGAAMREADTSSSLAILTESCVLDSINSMLAERHHSQATASPVADFSGYGKSNWPRTRLQDANTLSNILKTCEATSIAEQTPPVEPEYSISNETVVRDFDVDDAVWERLRQDTIDGEARDSAFTALLAIENQAQNDARRAVQERVQSIENLQTQIKHCEKQTERDEIKHQIERKRIENELKRRVEQEKLEELKKQRQVAEEERRKEAVARKKLRAMGACVAGYRWIKQSSGYRCAGGSHFVSNAQLDSLS